VNGRGGRVGAVAAVLAYLGVGIGYLAAVPPWEAPDEPAHLAYAEALAAGQAPDPRRTYEAHQPPAYYLLPAAVLRLLGRPALPRGTDNPYYPFAAAAIFHPVDEPEAAALRLLRSVSGLLGALVVALTWATGRRLGLGRRGAALAAAVVALLPQFQFIGHSLSNDGLATVAGALAGYGLVRWVMAEDRPGLVAVTAGFSLGLATKLNVLALLPAAGVAALGVARAGGRPRGSALAGLGVSLSAVAGLGVLMAVLAPGAARALADTAAARGAVLPSGGQDVVRLAWLAGQLPVSFFGRFGWLNVDLPRPAAWLAGAAALLALLGLARRLRRPGPGRWGLAVLLAAACSLGLATVWNLVADPQPQGRFLFPALAAIGVLLVAGWEAVVPGRLQAPWAATVVTALLVTDGLVVAVVLPGAYAPYRGAPPQVGARLLGGPPAPVLALAAGQALTQTFRASRPVREVAVPLARSAGTTLTLTLASAGGPVLDRTRVTVPPGPGGWARIVLRRPASGDLALGLRLDGPGRLLLWTTTDPADEAALLQVDGLARTDVLPLVAPAADANAPTAP
jgi:hypothetical protein